MGPNFSDTTQWNQSRIVGLEKQHIESENNKKITKPGKAAAIIGMVVLAAAIMWIIAMFLI